MKISDLDIESLSERLMISVMNYKKTPENTLDSYPHIIKGDMAIVAQLCMGDKNDNGLYTSCLTVTHKHLNMWNISQDSLFNLAIKSGAVLMKPTLEHFEGMKIDDKTNLPFSYVLTNRYHFNGASSIFYDVKMLGNISDKVILLPVTSNEIYVVSKIDENNSTEFITSVDAMYQDFCRKYDCGLSEHVYVYDKNNPEVLTDSKGNSFYLDLNKTDAVNETIDSQISHQPLSR